MQINIKPGVREGGDMRKLRLYIGYCLEEPIIPDNATYTEAKSTNPTDAAVEAEILKIKYGQTIPIFVKADEVDDDGKVVKLLGAKRIN